MVAHMPGDRAAIAQGQADHAIGHAGQEEGRGQDLRVAGGKLDQFVLLDADLAGRLLAHYCRVVPGEPRHRVGQFLQPAIVGEAAVVDFVGVEDQLVLALGRRTGWFGA